MAAGNLTVANSSLGATGYLDLIAGWDDWIGASSTQGGNLALSGTTQITAVDSVNLAAYASSAPARGGISLAGSITAPVIYVTAESNLTQSQSAALVMLGYSELSVTGGDVTLAESDNHFTTVNVTATKINGYGGVVSLSNAYPLVLAGVTAESLTLLTTAGDVTQASGGECKHRGQWRHQRDIAGWQCDADKPEQQLQHLSGGGHRLWWVSRPGGYQCP
jgi:hypothetical protein